MTVNGVEINDVTFKNLDNQTGTGIETAFFSSIDIDENYYNTRKQILLKNQTWFDDRYTPSKTDDGKKVLGLFYSDGIKKVAPTYEREYLSGSIDPYRQGVEIQEFKHWAAGYGKITAGTPGHLIEPKCFGINDLNIVSPDKFVEINLFNPVEFVNLQPDVKKQGLKQFSNLITYPIVTSDTNQAENYILNGIIEPFPIRSVISFFSINAPFEPHGVRGSFGNGNSNILLGNDVINSKDYYEPTKKNMGAFLDAVDMIGLQDENTSVVIGPTMGYFNIDLNKVSPFSDDILPRGQIKASYTGDLRTAILKMKPEGTTYISQKERTATTGFVYDDVGYAGTDSIAFGGLSY